MSEVQRYGDFPGRNSFCTGFFTQSSNRPAKAHKASMKAGWNR